MPPTTPNLTQKTKVNDVIPYEEDCFLFKKDGVTRRVCGSTGRGSASASSQSRAVLKITTGILNLNLNKKQQVVALRKASIHPLVRRLFKSAGLIDVNEYETMKYMAKQMERLIKLARQTEKKQGRANDDRRGLVESIVLSIITTPPSSTNNNEEKVPSKLSRLRILGISKTSGLSMMKKLEKKIPNSGGLLFRIDSRGCK